MDLFVSMVDSKRLLRGPFLLTEERRLFALLFLDEVLGVEVRFGFFRGGGENSISSSVSVSVEELELSSMSGEKGSDGAATIRRERNFITRIANLPNLTRHT